MASDILVVDDEADIRDIVSGILDDEGHETRTAADSDSALAAISDRVPRLIFLDIWLQGSRLDGLALLDEIKARYPDLPVVMISGHGNIEPRSRRSSAEPMISSRSRSRPTACCLSPSARSRPQISSARSPSSRSAPVIRLS
jgi:CheY-like chemotaxis protein